MSKSSSIMGFREEYAFLSDFYAASFTLQGVEFPTAEHAFHYFKTTDAWWRENILNAPTPGEAKKRGRRCPMRPDWDDVKVEVLRIIIRCKFEQNIDLRQKLLDTGYRYLEETNTWGDKFFGVCNGVGENNLGKLLMAYRNYLQLRDFFYSDDSTYL